MSDEERTEAESDSFVDAVAVVVGILIAVCAVVYWLSNQ